MKMESRFTNTPFTRPHYREKCDVKLPWEQISRSQQTVVLQICQKKKKNKNRVFTPLPKGVEGRGEETSDTLDYSLPRVVVTVMVSLSFPTPAIV